MSENDALYLVEEFVARSAERAEIANLCSESKVSDIAGDIGALPRIGKQSGRIAPNDFVNRFSVLRAHTFGSGRHSGWQDSSSKTQFTRVQSQGNRQNRRDVLHDHSHRANG